MITRFASGLAARIGALAVLFLLGSVAAAAAAPPTVVQVRVDRKLRCSASLIAPQYVLTARHCVGASPSRVRILAGSGALRVSKVATILSAPRANGRRPDLALVQLTSGSELKRARLGGDYSVPGGSRKVTARGWKSSARLKAAKGRLLRRSSACGRSAGRAKLLCARLPRAAVARRCKDAAGAGLFTRRKPTLIGVGTRSARGCRRKARVAFTPITSAVRTWVAEQTAAGGGTPTGEPTPGPTATPTPDPLASYPGTYQGDVSQDQLGNTRSYLTKVTIDRTGPAGQPAGTSGYGGDTSASGCGGVLELVNTDNGELTLLERLSYGQEFCIDGGTVRLLKVNGEDAVTYSWTKGPDDGRASGVLRRISG